SVEVVVPGNPVLVPSGDDMMRMGVPYGEAPNVQAKRLELEARAHERREEEMRRLWEVSQANRAPEHVVSALAGQYEKTADNIKTMAEQQILMLREQQKVLLDEITKKEDELKSLRGELISAKGEALESARNAESALERRLFAQHQGEINNLKDQFARELSQVER